MSSSDLIALAALLVSLYSVYYAWKSFKYSSHPKIDISFGRTYVARRNMYFNVIIENTHNSTNITSICVKFKVYRNLLGFIPIHVFTVGGGCGEIKAGNERDFNTMFEENADNSRLDNLIIKKFPNMIKLSNDKTMRTRQGTELRMQAEYYKVDSEEEFTIKVVAEYEINIEGVNKMKKTRVFRVKPIYNADDRFREYQGWKFHQK